MPVFRIHAKADRMHAKHRVGRDNASVCMSDHQPELLNGYGISEKRWRDWQLVYIVRQLWNLLDGNALSGVEFDYTISKSDPLVAGILLWDVAARALPVHGRTNWQACMVVVHCPAVVQLFSPGCFGLTSLKKGGVLVLQRLADLLQLLLIDVTVVVS